MQQLQQIPHHKDFERGRAIYGAKSHYSIAANCLT